VDVFLLGDFTKVLGAFDRVLVPVQFAPKLLHEVGRVVGFDLHPDGVRKIARLVVDVLRLATTHVGDIVDSHGGIPKPGGKVQTRRGGAIDRTRPISTLHCLYVEL